MGPGDNVVADPNAKDLIVQLDEKKGTRLVRVPFPAGRKTQFPFKVLCA